MCGRYAHTLPPEAMRQLFGTLGPTPNFSARYNVAPMQDAPVVRRHPGTGERRLDLLRWGLTPHFSRDATGAARRINARAETVATTPMFRDAFARRRALVPANVFYEWRTRPDGPKQPYAIGMVDDGAFAFAGLWESWRGASDADVLRSFAIITTMVNALVAPIHDRMPVILPPDAWPVWLGETAAAPEEALALLGPFPSEGMRAWPVGAAVGNVGNDGPDLLAEVVEERSAAARTSPPR